MSDTPKISSTKEKLEAVMNIPIPSSLPNLEDTTPAEEPFLEQEALKDVINFPGIDPAILEQALEAVIEKRRDAIKQKAKGVEPDWSTLEEKDYYNQELYIPVIEHDIPDYLNMRLKDTSYVAVWANMDQRRLGQLFAEGYEALRKEHVDPTFKLPLVFNSEGMYRYADVICLRVHKSIRVAKLRRIQDISAKQLKRVGADARIKSKMVDAILGDPYLEAAFLKKDMEFF